MFLAPALQLNINLKIKYAAVSKRRKNMPGITLREQEQSQVE